MTVTKRKDVRTPHVIMHKVADVRGGVSINTAELGGDYIREGAVLDIWNGICHVVKTAELVAGADNSGKDLKVKKYHNFKAGDVVMFKDGGIASKITKIVEGKDYDTLTLDAKLEDEIGIGHCIAEAKQKQTESGAALRYVPQAIVGTGKAFGPGVNVDTDAWVVAVTNGNRIPSFVYEKLKGIVELLKL